MTKNLNDQVHDFCVYIARKYPDKIMVGDIFEQIKHLYKIGFTNDEIEQLIDENMTEAEQRLE